MRRAGQLESAEEFLKKAETQNHNAPMIAGYNYCKGLHLWFVTILAKLKIWPLKICVGVFI